MSLILNTEKAMLRIGSDIGVSDWFLIDQARIDAFADTTLDHQFIHVDPERAAQGPFGSTIAHGLLTLSLLSPMVAQAGVMIEGAQVTLNYGFDKVRFLSPVKVGRRVRSNVKLLDLQKKGDGQYLLRQGITVEIENETKPALVAEWLMLAIIAEG
jgi:acyl dehydratase